MPRRCQTYWGPGQDERCPAFAEMVSLTVPEPTQAVTTALCPTHLAEWQSQQPRTDGRRLTLLPRSGDLCLVWIPPEPWEKDVELAAKLRG